MHPTPFPPASDDAVEIHAPGATAPSLIVCDHASNRIPGGLGTLGLSAADLARHIAWDIGAAGVARRLADRLGATAVLSRVSRLVIDCNRPLGHPESICRTSDGIGIPGNRDIDARQAGWRAASFYRPYHGAIAAELARLEAVAGTAAVLAIHSFTPRMGGQSRPWQVGVLWNQDSRLAVPLIDALRAGGRLCVGDNEPYSGRFTSHTTDTHGQARGRPHVSVEIRQDELADPRAGERWGDVLAEILVPLLVKLGLAPSGRSWLSSRAMPIGPASRTS